jgi:hypothetical protein
VNGAAVYQWCGFKSRRGKNKKLTALKSNSNTVWFNFQTYIYIYIYMYIHVKIIIVDGLGKQDILQNICQTVLIPNGV